MFGVLFVLQSCGNSGSNSGNPGGSGDISYDDNDIDYRAKAYDLVDQLYAASSSAEIETILMEILTIIGVPVYDHSDSALIDGSGSLSQGMALRDYHVYVLAESFFKYMENPSWHTTAATFAAGVQNLGGENTPVSIEFSAGGQTEAVPFDEGMVYYMANLYKTVSTVWGTTRPYFLADLFSALAEQEPAHGPLGEFYLDPLQAFLMKLDWFSKPLNPAEYISFSNAGAIPPNVMDALSKVNVSPCAMAADSGKGMDSAKGYWSIAQFVAGAAVDAVGTALNVGSVIAGEIIADGTQISIECDSPMYYGSGEHTIIISVAFGVDLSKFATDYGWTIGVDVPEKGPIKHAKVALVGWEDLAPRHGLFSGGNLDVLKSLAAGGAIADDSGDVSVNFTVKEQPDTTCSQEDQDTVELIAEVNPITDPTAWMSGIFNAVWPRSMPFWVDVRWLKSSSSCGSGYTN